MSQSGVVSWSQTAADDSTADSNVNWAEGQAPSSVNNSARAEMASVAKFRDDTAGSLLTSGSSTAYTVTTNQVFSSLTVLDGQTLSIRFDEANGADATLSVDGLAAKALQTASGVAVPAGVIAEDSIFDITYDNSIPAFILHGRSPLSTVEGAVPIGAGMDYWGSTAPSGWIFVYGQAISRTTYSSLFAKLGTTFGAGDGSTTFNVPDKRDRASFGKGDMGGTDAARLTSAGGGIDGTTLGASGGSETHTLTADELPADIPNSASSTTTITNNGTYTVGSSTSNFGFSGSGISFPSGTVTTPSFSGSTTTEVTINADGGGAHSIVPPGIVCNYIIYAGV